MTTRGPSQISISKRESARVLGNSGSKETALVQAFISSREGIHLSKAFLKIRDAKIRRSIVALVKQIAEL